MITEAIPESSIERQNKDKLYPPSSYGCEITPQQEEALMKGLSLDYKKRYQNITELKQSLLSKEEQGENKEKNGKQRRTKHGKKLIVITLIIGVICIGVAVVGKYRNDLRKAESKEWQEKSLSQYPRDSKQRLLLLNYLVKYGRYKGKGIYDDEKTYILPEWSVRKINVRSDYNLFSIKKE